MTEKKPVFRFVDELIFKQIDVLKQSQPYQQVMGQLNGLNDNQLKAANQAVSILIISIPVIILLIVFIVNISFNNQLQIKRDILSEINNYSSTQRQLQSLGKNIISGAAITLRRDFKSKVSNSLATAGGNRADLKVLDFESKPKDGIVKATGVIRFEKLSTSVLSVYLGDLVDRGKFRISNLQVKKNLKDNVVRGQIEVHHYGRAPQGK